MKWAVLAVVVAGAAVAAALGAAEVAEINAKQTAWTASTDTMPQRIGRERFVRMLGIDMAEYRHAGLNFPKKLFSDAENLRAPTSFDSRQNWPNCETMHDVRDQGHCGSCWAFSSAEVISDRECIANKRNVRISAEDINSCSEELGILRCGSCNGGQPACVLAYWKSVGVVSDECAPYTVPKCASASHPNASLPTCPTESYPTPPCPKKCNATGLDWAGDKHKAKTTYTVSGAANIATEVATNGPVVAAFTVYEDFEAYTGGIYHHVTGKNLGGHAVKIIGYGVESGQQYWIVANSWNDDWGEKGFFRIRRGNNECGFEDQVYAGVAASI